MSSDRFAHLFHASPVATSLSSLHDRRVVEVNDAYAALFGVNRADILGRTPVHAGILVSGPSRDELLRQLDHGKDITDQELLVSCPRGAMFVRVWSRRVEVDGAPHALSTFVDITTQRRELDLARLHEERFLEVAHHIHELYYVTDPDCHHALFVSDAYETLFGRPREALYADGRDWLRAVHLDDRERMLSTLAAARTELQEGHYRVVRGEEIRTLHYRLFPVKAPETGEVVRIAGVVDDVTEKLHLEAQVRQTQKLESLGLLAGGVAHDFNNVLAVIASSTGMLESVVPADHPDRELVDDIERAVRRASGLTRQLLAFSRKQTVEPVTLDVNAGITETRKMLRRMVGDDIVVETSLDPELPRIRIDAGYFVQVVMNLAVNARDAMPRGGRLTIASRTHTSERGREVVVEIADTGTGMSEEVKARVFEPFFTTKGLGQGTGLGLSVVHGIVQQAGGTIAIESERGIGTTVRLRFPAVDGEPEHVFEHEVHVVPGTETIMVVDDDVFVRRTTSRMLRTHGYKVLEANDGTSALRLLKAHGDDVALLVTDLVMPGIDGAELAELARAQRPGLGVLFISGYTDDALTRHGLERDRMQLVEKPFRGHVLARRVRAVLDRTAR